MLDLPTTVEKEPATFSAEAWQIRFHKAANAAPPGVIEVMEPRHLFAELRPMDAVDVLAAVTPQSRSSFTIVWIPQGGKVSASIEQDAEAWLLGGQVGNRTAVRAGIRTVRVFWIPGRALIYASPANISSALDAVVRFTVAQCDTIELENEMDLTWAAIEADASLTRSITRRRQLKQSSHVDAMTVMVTSMKAKFLRISRALEQLDPSLEDSSKRINAELVNASALYDRLELLEDPVQFALDHYEIINTRLGEARFAYREQRDAMIGHASQLAIVLLLVYALHVFW
jgi:hypothetical protein